MVNEKSIANGVLFYACLYVNGILITAGISTGRWIFMLLILLTLSLTVYLMTVIASNPDHLKVVGDWAEMTLYKQLEKLKRLY